MYGPSWTYLKLVGIVSSLQYKYRKQVICQNSIAGWLLVNCSHSRYAECLCNWKRRTVLLKWLLAISHIEVC